MGWDRLVGDKRDTSQLLFSYHHKKTRGCRGGGVEGNARSIRHVKNALFRSQPWSRVVNSTAPFSAIYPFSALKTACYDIILQS